MTKEAIYFLTNDILTLNYGQVSKVDGAEISCDNKHMLLVPLFKTAFFYQGVYGLEKYNNT